MNSASDSQPDKQNLFPRSNGLPIQSPVYWVSQKDRYLRQLLLADIETITKRPLIVYFTNPLTEGQIDFNDTKYLAEVLSSCDSKSIDLFVETRGGITDSAEKIILLLKNKVESFRVIVPHRAKSNGTLLALSSEEIVMGMCSELGPIDPLIGIDNTFVPANFIKNIPDMQNKQPIYFQRAELAIKQTRSIALKVLKEGMLKDKNVEEIEGVVDKLALAQTYFSHGSVIDYREAKGLGLKVQFLKPEDDLWKKLWLLYCMYEYDSKAKELAKIYENKKISNSVQQIKPKSAGQS
jgi:hypothetical protein